MDKSMTHAKGYEILGIGRPIIDYILPIPESYLKHLGAEKGGMVPVEYITLMKIIKESQVEPIVIAGGSTSNTIKGLQNLGQPSALLGHIGCDTAGEMYLQNLNSLGVIPLLKKDEEITAQVVCLITPDGERTCRSYLGTSKMKAEDLNAEFFEGVKLVHVEGYTLINGSIIEEAMKLAKAAGAKISLDLSSFEVVNKHREFLSLLISKYVDVLFANERETESFTNLDSMYGFQFLKDFCETTIMMRGKEGCIVSHDNQIIQVPGRQVEALDTTGAGDLFASGFLYAFVNNLPIEICARIGTTVAANVVQTYGAELPKETWSTIKKEIIQGAI